LENQLRKQYDLKGVPIDIFFRKKWLDIWFQIF
jgi:predicted GTPase